MKQLTKNNKIIIGIVITILIFIGTLVTIFFGFNKDSKYEHSQRIDISINQKVEIEKVQEKVNEVLGKDNIVQVVEIYEDMVTIRAKSISEDQKNQIINKLKEIYEFDQKAEDTAITEIPSIRFRDLYKPYIMPFIVTTVLITLFFIVKFRQQGIVKLFIYTLLSIIIGEISLLSILAITRLPIGRTTPVILIIAYIVIIMTLQKYFEEIKQKNIDKNK